MTEKMTGVTRLEMNDIRQQRWRDLPDLPKLTPKVNVQENYPLAKRNIIAFASSPLASKHSPAYWIAGILANSANCLLCVKNCASDNERLAKILAFMNSLCPPGACDQPVDPATTYMCSWNELLAVEPNKQAVDLDRQIAIFITELMYIMVCSLGEVPCDTKFNDRKTGLGFIKKHLHDEPLTLKTQFQSVLTALSSQVLTIPSILSDAITGCVLVIAMDVTSQIVVETNEPELVNCRWIVLPDKVVLVSTRPIEAYSFYVARPGLCHENATNRHGGWLAVFRETERSKSEHQYAQKILWPKMHPSLLCATLTSDNKASLDELVLLVLTVHMHLISTKDLTPDQCQTVQELWLGNTDQLALFLLAVTAFQSKVYDPVQRWCWLTAKYIILHATPWCLLIQSTYNQIQKSSWPDVPDLVTFEQMRIDTNIALASLTLCLPDGFMQHEPGLAGKSSPSLDTRVAHLLFHTMSLERVRQINACLPFSMQPIESRQNGEGSQRDFLDTYFPVPSVQADTDDIVVVETDDDNKTRSPDHAIAPRPSLSPPKQS
jgi:hypothetical protein